MLNGLATLFLWIDQTAGINLTILYDPFDRHRFFLGLLTTLELSVVCLAGSVAIGGIGAWLQQSRFRPTSWLTNAYVGLFRNTPPLIQLYFFYFVLGNLLRTRNSGGAMTQIVSNFAWAAISLSFYFGSFNVEALRAGIEAVPRTTVEAAEALGYNRLQIYIHVVLPLAFRVSLPALGNNLVGLVKATSLAYAIAVPEIFYVSSEIWADELNVPEMMSVLLVFYFLLVGIVVFAVNRLERAMRIPLV